MAISGGSEIAARVRTGLRVHAAGCCIPLFVLGGAASVSGAVTNADALVAVERPAARTVEEGFHRLLFTGRTMMSERRWREAAEVLERAGRMEPDSEDVMFLLGTALTQTGRHGEALKLLERLLVKHPDDPIVKNNIAWIYLRASDPALLNAEKALRYAREAVFQLHGEADLWATLADAHEAAGDRVAAERAARVAAWLVRETKAAQSRDRDYSDLLRRFSRDASNSD